MNDGRSSAGNDGGSSAGNDGGSSAGNNDESRDWSDSGSSAGNDGGSSAGKYDGSSAGNDGGSSAGNNDESRDWSDSGSSGGSGENGIGPGQCGGPGWRRVAFLNMTDPNHVCPLVLIFKTYPTRAHGRSNSSKLSCSSTTFSVGDSQYSWVCGKGTGLLVALKLRFF